MKKDIEPYMDEKFQNNILLTQTERLTMNGRPANPKYARNKNVLVIGGSGSGKTRFYVKPNLMQMHSSYCVTDPKGTIVLECGKMLEDNGYEIKILNTINFKKSMKYNHFAYIRSEKDILKLVQTIIANTKGEGEKAGEDFWVKAEKLYYTALIGYIFYEAPREEKNFATLFDMIDASEVREDDETYMNPIISVDGEDPSFITASITEAYRFYREHKDDLADDEYCELTAREIEISDKEWTELINKGKLDYSDYSKYETRANFRGLAWNFSYKGKTDSDDSTLEELLIVQSENFNMRVICERAGISYSTYRGFKNNKQPFSRQKIYELLRTMKAIGSECWDEDLEDAYKINKSIVEKYHLD